MTSLASRWRSALNFRCWLVAFAQVEFCHCDRAVLAITLRLLHQNKKRRQCVQHALHRVTVLAFKWLAKHLSSRVCSFGRALYATDQVMRILALEALIEREHFQTCKADQVGVLDPFDSNSATIQ